MSLTGYRGDNMREIIELQFKTLRLYPQFDEKYANSLNKGNANDFMLKLLDYEKKLSKMQMYEIDKKLEKKYSLDSQYWEDQDEQWAKIEEELWN
jgi:hypothetical protein